jgi:signal transduction histidine kinase
MILLFSSQKDENARIRKLNEQLNQANDQLRDYAVNMERMTQMRERNRLAREIHDTLGHTLTGIIMGADV